MEITPMKTTDANLLQLFSEHDDYMIAFLGEDKGCYTRYSEKENIEKAWVGCSDNLPIGCVAYRQKANGVGEVKRLFIRKEYRGKGISKELLKTVEDYAKEQGCHTLFLDTREVPEGWAKWSIPGYEYIYVENEGGDTFSEVIRYLQENDIPLVGAVQEFNCPETGKGYLFFPIRKL